MRRILLTCLVALYASVTPVWAQQAQKEAEIKRAVPYSRMLRTNPDMTLQEYNAAVRALAAKELREEGRATSPGQWQAPTPAPIYTPPVYVPPVYTPYSAPAYTPRSGTTYDAQSGNSYSWRKKANGDTDVNGMNLQNGTMWQTTIKPNGSMNGTDGKMNPWSYDAKTKSYMNYGTGRICIGEGYARVCTGGE